MTRPYSPDLRERALARYEAGETIRAIGAALAISPSCVSKWHQRQRATGSLAPGQIGGHKKRVLSGACAAWLEQRVRAAPFTLRGLGAELAARGVTTDRRAVWVFVHALNLSFKKSPRAAERTRPDVARKRRRWQAHQGRIAASRLVFLDETWVKTNMAPLRGWGLRGQRLVADVPHGHWRTLTFIAALRQDRIEAPWVIDRPLNGALFRLYVERMLLPTLRAGDVVVLDNLGSHKQVSVRRQIRQAGAHLMLLPSYSPDLNPIEQLFAKLKHLIRKAEPRTVEAAWRTIGELLDHVTPAECANYLRNSGYAAV
jgi:transposase